MLGSYQAFLPFSWLAFKKKTLQTEKLQKILSGHYIMMDNCSWVATQAKFLTVNIIRRGGM